MSLLPHRLFLLRPPQLLDFDARNFISRVEAVDGSPLENVVKTAINSFVIGCKQDGTWDAIKASCILAGARTLSGALVPLVGTAPTNFNFVSGDYNRKTGLVGDGTTKYLNSNRADNASGYNKHFGVFMTASGGSLQTVIGNNVATYGATINMQSAGSSTEMYLNNILPPALVLTPATPFFLGGSRSGNTVNMRAGANTSTSTSTASINTAANNFVFARNSGTSANNYTSSRLAFYSIGESLDLALLDARVTTLINAFAAAIP